MPDTKKTSKLETWTYYAALAIIAPIYCPLCCIWLCSRCIYDRCTGAPSGFYCGNARIQHFKRKADMKALEAEAPAPLPKQRTRRLSLPLPPSQRREGLLRLMMKKKKQVTCDQLQSVLFGRFPLEVREMIYGYVLAGSEHVHVFRRTDRRLGYYDCRSRHGEEHEFGPASNGKSRTGAWTPRTGPDRDEIGGMLSLLKTCRRVYSESIDLLYRKNCFCFSDAKTFEFFTRTVLPARLRSIEVVQLHQSMYDLFAQGLSDIAVPISPIMTGLRQLRLMILPFSPEENPGLKSYFESIRQRYQGMTDAEIIFITPNVNDLSST